MSIEFLKAAAESNQWAAVLPEIMLACGALFLLVMEIALPRSQHRFIPWAAVLTLGAVLVAVLSNYYTTPWLGQTTFNGLLRHGVSSQVARVFFVVSSLLVCFLAGLVLPRSKLPRVEFYHIVLVVTAAMMLLVQSNHFVMFFVALETVTVGFYILVSYFRNNPLTLEAGLKYLIMGALSSAIMLFGIVMLYGAVGRVDGADGLVHSGFEFDVVANYLSANPENMLGLVGAGLVLAGVAFKIGAFPFQIWVPDVYQGAPTPVTAFLAVSSKAAGFAVLLTLVREVFVPLQAMLVPLLSAAAMGTLIFGNVAALTQRNAKRLMGLSGVSHAGFLLIGVVASLTVDWAPEAVWFYLFTYLLASMAVFGVMAHLSGEDDTVAELDGYDGLAKSHPLLGAVLAIGVGSLAGIPPLAGFIGKLFIFMAAFEAQLYWVLAVAVGCVIISIYYYFGWIKAAWFATWLPEGEVQESTQPVATVTRFRAVVLVLLAGATVLLGFFQEPLTQWLLLK